MYLHSHTQWYINYSALKLYRSHTSLQPQRYHAGPLYWGHAGGTTEQKVAITLGLLVKELFVRGWGKIWQQFMDFSFRIISGCQVLWGMWDYFFSDGVQLVAFSLFNLERDRKLNGPIWTLVERHIPFSSKLLQKICCINWKAASLFGTQHKQSLNKLSLPCKLLWDLSHMTHIHPSTWNITGRWSCLKPLLVCWRCRPFRCWRALPFSMDN